MGARSLFLHLVECHCIGEEETRANQGAHARRRKHTRRLATFVKLPISPLAVEYEVVAHTIVRPAVDEGGNEGCAKTGKDSSSFHPIKERGKTSKNIYKLLRNHLPTVDDSVGYERTSPGTAEAPWRFPLRKGGSRGWERGAGGEAIPKAGWAGQLAAGRKSIAYGG